MSINPDKKHQGVDNFTASDAWIGNFVGQYFSENDKAQIAKWLFSDKMDAEGNVEGIVFSLWRVNIGEGSLEQDGADIYAALVLGRLVQRPREDPRRCYARSAVDHNSGR